MEYLKSIGQLNDTLEREKECRRKHSSAWLDDIIGRYGKEYVKQHENLILTNLQAKLAQTRNEEKEQLMRLLYSEMMLVGSYKEYMNLFFKYYESLDPEEQGCLKSRKEAADSLLKLMDRSSISSLYEQQRLREILYSNQAIAGDRELYRFFSHNPRTECLDPSKATEALLTVTRGGKP